jgi:hypothetical protein
MTTDTILPATLDILVGAPFYSNAWINDLVLWASLPAGGPARLLRYLRRDRSREEDALAIAERRTALARADRLEVAEIAAALEDLHRRVARLPEWELGREVALRTALYGAEAGSRRLLVHLSRRVDHLVYSTYGTGDLVACAAGLKAFVMHSWFRGMSRGETVAQAACDSGRRILLQHEVGLPVPEGDSELAKILNGVEEAYVAGLLKEEPRSTIVVPAASEKKSISDLKPSRLRERQASDIAGQALPLVTPPDPHDVRAGLVSRWPHAAGIIDTLLRDVSRRGPAKLGNTIVVGAPGSGKSALCTALADALGLPSLLYPCGGSADASLAGTSAQWSTARESVVLRTIRQHRVANPVLVLDEIEKTGTGRENGALLDALLSLTEPSTARRFLDPMLEVETDLSHVSWLATSNDVAKIPAPLRDRFRILRMPDPQAAHLPALLAGILADIAAETDGSEWAQALAGDEIAAIAEAWGGGSLRRLRRIVEVVVGMRDAHAPRH